MGKIEKNTNDNTINLCIEHINHILESSLNNIDILKENKNFELSITCHLTLYYLNQTEKLSITKKDNLRNLFLNLKKIKKNPQADNKIHQELKNSSIVDNFILFYSYQENSINKIKKNKSPIL